MLKTRALKVARYEFKNEKGKEINTSKLIVSFGEFGSYSVCSELANEYPLLTELTVNCDIEKNKIVIKSIEK